MLIENTLFGVVDKVQNAIDLLKQHEPHEGYFVCFSGGKDSVVMYDLVKRSGVKFDAHHSNTTVEPPQLMKFIRQHYPNVINDRAKTTMYQLIVKKKIPPLRTARYCCTELKEIHGKGRVIVTGIRAEESPRRAKRKQYELNTKGGGAFLHIIRDWSLTDVWQYIHENNLPYCELYDLGFKRIGCVLCPFQSYEKSLRDLQMFTNIADYYRRACRKSFQVNTFTQNWQSGDDIFNWWIESRKHNRVVDDCNSIPLFSEDDGYLL